MTLADTAARRTDAAESVIRDIEAAIRSVVYEQQAALVRLDQTLMRAQTVEVARVMVKQSLRDAGVRRIESLDEREWFPGVSEDSRWIVVEPAYVDVRTGRLVQPGVAEEVADALEEAEEE